MTSLANSSSPKGLHPLWAWAHSPGTGSRASWGDEPCPPADGSHPLFHPQGSMLWAAVLRAQTLVPTLSWALCQVLRQGERIGRHVPVWRMHTQKPVILALGINMTTEGKELPTPSGARSRSEKLHPGGRLVCLKGEQELD